MGWFKRKRKKYKPQDFLSPSKDAIREAKLHPNGYVYAVDEEFQNKANVPAENIIGWWKVNDNGIIDGPFIYSPNHWSKQS